MHLVLISAIVVNILTVIMMTVGLLHKFEQPKNKAVYGYLIAGCMFLYIVTLSLALIYGCLEKHYLYSFVLFLCVISPFVIGKFVKYETLKKYTVIQILCFVVSLVTILGKLFN